MTDRTGPAYGTPNWEMLGRWLQIEPEQDGPFWALNLMKYHPVARYADGQPGVSGRDADDAYAPLGPLAAVGAVVAFHGDVLDQLLGHPVWDRVGIVRYPTRAAFFAMQQRDDFKSQHVHKEAGMEFTIVMSCLPLRHNADVPAEGSLVLVVEGDTTGPDEIIDGAAEVAAFTVEGVIVGDERSFERVRLVRAASPDTIAALSQAASAGAAHVLVLDPLIDRLVETIESA